MIQVIGTGRYSVTAMKMAQALKELDLTGQFYDDMVRSLVVLHFDEILQAHDIKGVKVTTDHELLYNVINANGMLVSFIDEDDQNRSFTLIYTPKNFDVPKSVFAAVPKTYF